MIKACSRSNLVVVYAYHHAAEVWFKGIENKITRLKNLQIWRIPSEKSQELAKMAERSMQLQATIQEHQLMMSNGKNSVDISFERWY